MEIIADSRKTILTSTSLLLPLKGKTLQSSNLGLAQTGLQTKPHHMQKKELSKERDATKVSLGHQQGDFFCTAGGVVVILV